MERVGIKHGNADATEKAAAVTLTPAPGGFIQVDRIGRESFVPASLVFTRKSGAKYVWIAREVGEWPRYETKDCIRSVSSGRRKWMSESELIEFKKG